MAGYRRSNAIAEALAARASAYFEPEDDATPEHPEPCSILDYVACWVADGKTVKALALELTTELHFEVWAETLLRMLKRTFGELPTESALDAARVRASHAMAEEALELVDAQADTQVDVSRAASRARSRQWLAERYNPQRFGQSKGVTVSINVASLHLDALRSTPKAVTGGALHAIATGDSTSALPSQAVAVQVVSSE